jgi:hypothetical protein
MRRQFQDWTDDLWKLVPLWQWSLGPIKDEDVRSGEHRYWVKVTTVKHQYRITAVFRDPAICGSARHYLGCTMTNRLPDPGEDWLRGSDLADGRFGQDTWDKIVADILTLEAGGGKYDVPWRKKLLNQV